MSEHSVDFIEYYGARLDRVKYVGTMFFPDYITAKRAEADYNDRVPVDSILARYRFIGSGRSR